MKPAASFFIFSSLFLFTSMNLRANLIYANPGNYQSFLNSLFAGDTFYLSSGIYSNNLKLNGINGTASQPILIIGNGNSTVFTGQSCCNTISITKCSYLIIKNLKLDGLHQQIDAIKAEGTSANWAHHITLEYLNILNYDGDQQNIAISTKCPAWNWIIRKNKIQDAGTGMYLGNSSGDKPFVNGIIEYNYIANTIGYNIEIKHQLNGVRDEFPGIAINGKTIIRNNVFTKNEKSSTGGNARPNLLVGGFPSIGWGSLDYYEIYGNFFFNNPVEALFQGTGNINIYENIFVNHYDPPGFRAIYITPQNGISPQDVKVFHNTVWVANTSGGLRLYNPNNSYNQYCYGNAVFSALPISNFSDILDNITDSYSNAFHYVISATRDIQSLDLYPQSGQLTGPLTAYTLFNTHNSWDKDFNGDPYDWTYRGAYSGCCINKAWHLQLDTISNNPMLNSTNLIDAESNYKLYPNPVSSLLYLHCEEINPSVVEIYNSAGEKIFTNNWNEKTFSVDFHDKTKGIYFIFIKQEGIRIFKKFIKQ